MIVNGITLEYRRPANGIYSGGAKHILAHGQALVRAVARDLGIDLKGWRIGDGEFRTRWGDLDCRVTGNTFIRSMPNISIEFQGGGNISLLFWADKYIAGCTVSCDLWG